MINRVVILVVLLIGFSCSKRNKIPLTLTDKVSLKNVVLHNKLIENKPVAPIDSIEQQVLPSELAQLNSYKIQYFEKNEDFNLHTFKSEWENVKSKSNVNKMNFKAAVVWFEVTGLLFQLTSDAKYAENLEKMVFTRFQYIPENKVSDAENLILPYIFTRNVDHIHINIFSPSEINYTHTLHGKVKIIQKPDFSEKGFFTIEFQMEQRQYIELFIRIPVWAEDGTVTVKGVKYFAKPGSYCQIAKKWKQGDVVEIYFPSENIPDYFK